MSYNPEPQLHSQSEISKLVECAQSVPANGVILEVGTFLGGSTFLIRENSSSTVELFSVDVNQSLLPTRTLLAEKNITFLEGTSESVASKWKTKIDFLFIDGGHRLCDTLNDFNAWIRHLKSSACVAFHDYDEPIAGGIYFFGVKIVVDTLLRLGILSNIEHHTSLLTARIIEPNLINEVTHADILETLRIHSVAIVKSREYFSPILLEKIINNQSVSEIMRDAPDIPFYIKHKDHHPLCQKLNQLTLCYIFDEWVKTKTADMISLTGRQDIGLFLEMMLWVDAERRTLYPYTCAHDSIFSKKYYPDSLEQYTLSSVQEIARFATLEQVRLNMISRVTNPIFRKILSAYS